MCQFTLCSVLRTGDAAGVSGLQTVCWAFQEWHIWGLFPMCAPWGEFFWGGVSLILKTKDFGNTKSQNQWFWKYILLFAMHICYTFELEIYFAIIPWKSRQKLVKFWVSNLLLIKSCKRNLIGFVYYQYKEWVLAI